MASPRRVERSESFLLEEVSDIIRNQMADPRLAGVLVTKVRLSPDRRYAKVFVSVSGDDAAEEEALKALQKAAGFVRRCLAKRVHWYMVPEVTFQLDMALKQGDRVLTLLRELREQEGSAENALLAPARDEEHEQRAGN